MIKITNNLFIDSDSYCYMVKKFLGYDKNNEPKYDTLTYHSRLHEALESILNRQQRALVNENDMTLTETLEKFKTLRNEILCVLEGVREKEEINDE